MAHAGDELLNPVSGQRLVFLRTTEDTRGELLEVESANEAGGQQPPVHYHPAQEERFEVPDGTVEIKLVQLVLFECSPRSAACSATAPPIPDRAPRSPAPAG